MPESIRHTADLDISDFDCEILRGMYVGMTRHLVHFHILRSQIARDVAKEIGLRKFPGKRVIVHNVRPHDGTRYDFVADGVHA